MNHRRTESHAIWLRGNLRPVTWLAALVAVAVLGLGAAAAFVMPAAPAAWLAVAVFSLVMAAVVGALACAAARPRLVCAGDRLLVRLSPTVVHEVPLDVVECFFQGSNPIARTGEPTCGDHAAFRVNTLVMRLAERATDFSTRPTFTPWGTWGDNYVVFDGRWCEPLSAELARRLSRELLDAKRAAAAVPPPAGAGS